MPSLQRLASLASNMIRTGEKTPVSQLQEYMVKNGGVLPKYELVHSGSSCKVMFKFKLCYLHLEVFGEGLSKQEAKHNTAKAMLIKLGQWRGNVEPKQLLDPSERAATAPSSFINAVGALNEFCVQFHRPTPNYIVVKEEGPPHNREFTMKCTVGDLSEVSSANSKQDAKHQCATKMLKTLKNFKCENSFNVLAVRQEQKPLPEKFDQVDLPDITESLKQTTISCPSSFNAVGALNEACVKYRLPSPEYFVVLEEGPPHESEMTIMCTVGDISEVSSARTKQDAKHQCAIKMLGKVKGLCHDNSISAFREKCKSASNNVESVELPVSAERIKSSSFHPPSSFNAVGVLNELCARHRLPAAEYCVVKEEGPPHLREFTLKCTVGTESEEASANSKQEAKRQCAAKMLLKLKNLPLNLLDLGGESAPRLSEEELKQIITKFKASSSLLKNRQQNSSTQLPIKDYHNVARLGPNVKSAVIDDLSGTIQPGDFCNLQTHLEDNYMDVFQELLKELNLKHDFILIPPHHKSRCAAITLNINYTIPVSFLGIGETMSKAKQIAIIDAVSWLVCLHT